MTLDGVLKVASDLSKDASVQHPETIYKNKTSTLLLLFLESVFA